ncbi:MAG: SBBP repeat-containing protein [Candidatus Thorarchaeota archaeon]
MRYRLTVILLVSCMLLKSGVFAAPLSTEVNDRYYAVIDSTPLNLNDTFSIDVLAYSTFIGGSDKDRSYHLALDAAGNIYVGGTTSSSDFPATDSYDYTWNGGSSDCFVVKINTTGDVVYSTFIGGSDDDITGGIGVDSAGCVYLAGLTASANFPTVDAFDDTLEQTDGFVCKLNAAGDDLEYSTFLGGSLGDMVQGLAVSSDGVVCVVGITESSDFPIVNALDNTHNGMDDCFVTKLSSTGSLVFSTFVGGSAWDDAYGVDMDVLGNAYVCGTSQSTDFPTVSEYDGSFGGEWDAVAFKISSDGGTLEYSTYLGGSSYDGAFSIAVDSEGYAWIVGETYSGDYPVFYPFRHTMGGYDGFLTKLNPTGDSLSYSTYIGGRDYDIAWDVAVNSWDEAFVIGGTPSTNLPVFNAYDDTFNGVYDVFVMKFGSYGKPLFLTFFGGSQSDGPGGICVDDNGYIYASGWTYSSDFPLVNASDATQNGNEDVFVFKLMDLSDSDQDSLPDYFEIAIGTNPHNFDSDFDSMPDGWEYQYDLNPLVDDASGDADSDGLSNLDEYLNGCSPRSPDSDFDAMPDKWEVDNHLDPARDDSMEDLDDDWLTNILEFQIGTLAFDWDSDDDMMPDGWEVDYGLDPLVVDSHEDPDGDTLTNINEYNHGTSPISSDTDQDSMPDPWEIQYGLNPLVNDAMGDRDGDTLLNYEEYLAETSPNLADTDGDSIPDAWEINNGFDPNDPRASHEELMLYRLPDLLLGVVVGLEIPVVLFLLGRRFSARRLKRQ